MQKAVEAKVKNLGLRGFVLENDAAKSIVKKLKNLPLSKDHQIPAAFDLIKAQAIASKVFEKLEPLFDYVLWKTLDGPGTEK